LALPKDPIVLELPTAIMANGDNGKAVEAQEPTAVMQQATNPPPTVVEELVISEEELKAQEEWNTFLANLPTSINTINLTLIALTNFANELEPRITALEQKPDVVTQNIGSVDQAAIAAQIAEINAARLAEFRTALAAGMEELTKGFQGMVDKWGNTIAAIEREIPQLRAEAHDAAKKSAVQQELGRMSQQLVTFGQNMDNWSKTAENLSRILAVRQTPIAPNQPIAAPTQTLKAPAPIAKPSWMK